MLSEKGNIISLIALPTNFFLNDADAKSILVMTKKKEGLKQGNSSVYMLPKIEEKEAFMNTVQEIIKHIKNNK